MARRCELTRRIRNGLANANPIVPVILMTAYTGMCHVIADITISRRTIPFCGRMKKKHEQGERSLEEHEISYVRQD